MTPQERTVEFTRLAAEMDAESELIVSLRNQVATKQVKLDQAEARYKRLRGEARALLPVAPEVPE